MLIDVAIAHPLKHGFRFGRFEVDLRSRELRKDGVRLRLQDQPFEVLVMLLQQPHEVLTREELRRRLWPDGTFVDFEHGLNATVKRLRTALGDEADNPRFVETLPRRGYRFIGEVDRIESDAGGADRRRLAVLPFTTFGQNDADAYFSEGLTEEMITQLGRVCATRLGVVARTSSMLVRQNARTVREIGRALNVEYLVEGSVRREGDRVRITVQLIDARAETQVWAESYERHLSDCFLVQSQVSAAIAHSLAMELLPDGCGTRQSGPQHAFAHQIYLKGRYHWNKAAGEGLHEAIRFYEQALALDSSFAGAHAALGRAQVAAADYYVIEPRSAFEAGRLAATRALEIDPNESDAHLALAEIQKAVDWNWDSAEAAYRRALTSNPSNEGAHRLYGLFLAARGRSAEAAAAAQRAYDLDPLCLVVNTSAAWVRYVAGDHDEAIDRCRHTLDMDAHFAPAHRVLAAATLQKGQVADAIVALERATTARPDAVTAAWLAHALALGGHRARAADVLEPFEAGGKGYVSPYHLAVAYTGMGDAERALTLLAAAFEARDPSLVNLAVEPRFAPLASDSRFPALADRLRSAHGQQAPSTTD